MTVAGKAALEEGRAFTPTFDPAGLVVCITTERASGDVLMVAYMNAEALRRTLDTRIVHYWSRSRGELWRKGDTSGQIQHLIEMRTDCDQDALLLVVDVGGDGHACHTGRHSCFYRTVVTDGGRVSLSPSIALNRVLRANPQDPACLPCQETVTDRNRHVDDHGAEDREPERARREHDQRGPA